ncbi:MAG: metallophosphoesterase [Planctomycetota bacterium]
MRLVWTTDPHLNHAPVRAFEQWIDELNQPHHRGLILTGDISEGDDVVFELLRIAERIPLPILFVLGNHDFYDSSIASTRRRVIDVCAHHPQLHYLTDRSPIDLVEMESALTPGTVFLIGEDGWGDASTGNYDRSPVRLNDFRWIQDFRDAEPDQWKAMLLEQGRQSALRLEEKLSRLPPTASHVMVATHVPPFQQACWYEGRTTDEFWAPFFVCGQVGDVVTRFAESRPHCYVTVLCGHTHHEGVACVDRNLIVHTGAAQYGRPAIEGFVTADSDQLYVTRRLET